MQPIWRTLSKPVYRLALWGLFILFLLAMFLFQQNRNHALLSTDLLELLPAMEQDSHSAAASASLARNFSNSVVFTIASESKQSARSAARQFGQILEDSGLFARLVMEIDPGDWQRLYTFYQPFRYVLLSDREQTLPAEQLAEALTGRTASRLASPLAMTNSQQLISDPLFQMTTWLESFAADSGNVNHDDGLLAVKKDGLYHVISYGLLEGESLSLGSQVFVVNSIHDAVKQTTAQYPETDITSSGMIFYAKAGADSARSEVSTIGAGSTLGIIVLILVAFRTLSPLFFCLLSVATGILAGYVSTVAVFGQIHIMTLVFGASLTGVSIDYAFHFLTERLRQGKQWSPLQGLKHIFPGVTLGLMTSLLGYVPMLTTPFPGLQQMAVFSSAGLVAAWLTVVLAYPALLHRKNRATPSSWPLPMVDALLHFWKNHLPARRSNRLFALLSLLALSLVFLQTNDDIRQLQSREPTLQAAEERIKSITGDQNDNRFYLVRGRSEQQLLRHTEQLSQALAQATAAGHLQGYRSVSSLLPARETQRQNYEKIASVFNHQLPELWQQLGFSEAAQEQAIAAFRDAEQQVLMPEQWLEHPVSEMYRHLWLGQHGDHYFSAVLLSGVNDSWNPASLESLPEVEFIDITGSTSELFGRYRVLMSWLLTIAYSIITVLLALRYGLRGAVNIVLPPLLSVLLTLSLLTITAQAINLFHVLALIMVLGIGIDYTLFFREAGNEQRYTFMAITLSAMTTLLSFGLLALSATAAIRGVGLTVLMGILFCYLLSPYAIRDDINETD